jgi:hypothetical protein
MKSKYIVRATIYWIFSTSFAFSQDCEIITYDTRCVINGSKLTTTVDITLQINKREGDDYGIVYIPYSKSDQIDDIQASITDSHGKTVKKLKKTEIAIRSAVSNAALYEDDFVKVFQMKHNVYPYRVHYSYSHTISQFLSIADWNPSFYNLPAHNATLVVEVPPTFDFLLYEKDITKTETVTTKGDKVYTWRASDVAPVARESYSPNRQSVLPNVRIVPKAFQYGLEGNMTSWEDYGTWQYKTNEGLDDLPDFEKANIDRVIAGATDTREKARGIYHYLQDHMRYILVKEGIGGLKPYPASYVASNKYGDCKALTNYMMAALKYAGIPSNYTKVFAGDKVVPLIEELPSQQFNHVIVTIPNKGDTIWLECTSKYNPFGYLGTFTQNREVLFVSPDDSRLIKTPALNMADVREQRTVVAEVTPTGKTLINLEIEFRGDKFETFTYLLNEYTRTEQEEYVRQVIDLPEYTLINWELKRQHRDSASIFLTAELTTNNFVKKYGDSYVVRNLPLDIPSTEVPAKRSLPFELYYPIYQEETVTIKFPQDFVVDKLPQEMQADSDAGAYRVSSYAEGNEVHIKRSYIVQPGNYSGKGYEGFYDQLAKVKNLEASNLLTLKKAN